MQAACQLFYKQKAYSVWLKQEGELLCLRIMKRNYGSVHGDRVPSVSAVSGIFVCGRNAPPVDTGVMVPIFGSYTVSLTVFCC